jgi:hypothetical protein
MRILEVEFSQFDNRCQVIFLVLLEIPILPNSPMYR